MASVVVYWNVVAVLSLSTDGTEDLFDEDSSMSLCLCALCGSKGLPELSLNLLGWLNERVLLKWAGA